MAIQWETKWENALRRAKQGGKLVFADFSAAPR